MTTDYVFENVTQDIPAATTDISFENVTTDAPLPRTTTDYQFEQTTDVPVDDLTTGRPETTW